MSLPSMAIRSRSSDSQLSRGGVSVDDSDLPDDQINAAQGPVVDQASKSADSSIPPFVPPDRFVELSESNDSDVASKSIKQEKDAILSTNIVALQVGERQFTTRVSTLTDQSDYFKSMFSGRWALPRLNNGYYFFDADGDVFAHIMRYLRLQICPVLYDRANGHDYVMYEAILDLAEFLGISKLAIWIKDQKFHDAVVLKYSVEHVQSLENVAKHAASNQKLSFYPLMRTRKVYLCPRGIVVHRGCPERCGQACMKAKGNEPYQYEDEVVPEFVQVTETVIFDLTKFGDSDA